MNKIKLPKEFKLHLASRLISYSGDNISSIATMLYVLVYSNSYMVAALNLAVSFIPQILFSTYAGNLADQKNNKFIMSLCDVINSIFALLLALIVFSGMSIYWIFVITFVMNTCDTFHSMSSATFVKDIIKDDKLYLPANSLSMTTQKTLGIVFNIVGALMCDIFGYTLVFLFNALSFILSGCIRQLIVYEYKEKIVEAKSNGVMAINLEIITLLIKEHRTTFLMFIVQGAILNIILAPLSLYMPVFIKESLSMSDLWYGVFITMIPLGNILYSMNSIRILNYISIEKSVILAYYLQGISFLIWFVGFNFISGSIGLFVLGFSLAMTGINISTMMQKSISKEIYGKVSGVGSMILSAAVPVGYLLGGFVMNIIDLKIIFLISGLLVLFSTYIVFRYNTN